MIKRIAIAGYKSLGEASLGLAPLSVIVGPNASGKSNLFDALRLLSAMVTQPDLKIAFDAHRGIPVEAFFTESGISALLEEDQLHFRISADVLLSDRTVNATEQRIRDLREGLATREQRHVTERYLQYSVDVEFRPDTGVLRVADERLVALNADGTERRSRNPFFERVNDRISLRMEGQAHPTMHDVGLPYTQTSQSLYAPHYPHIIAFREEVSMWQFYYFDPLAMRESAPLKEAKSVGKNGQDLASYLHTVKSRNPRQFETISKAITNIIPSVSGVDVQRTKDGFVELLVLENGAAYSARVISEGTLRILGLLAILSSDDNTTVGFEEPENGVHPRRITVVANMLADAAGSDDRQLLVTTHSPLLARCFNTLKPGDRKIVVAQRDGRRSVFAPLDQAAPLLSGADIEAALDERLIRGDYGG